MKRLIIKNSHASINEEDILKLEKSTGITLPKDYKKFLLLNNGGVPSPFNIKTRDGKIESSIKKFLPLANIKEDNLLEEIKGITLAGQIPKEVIPIAIDPADNRIVLGTKGDKNNKVFYWAWDEEKENHKKPSYKYMRIIADSFEEFLNKIY